MVLPMRSSESPQPSESSQPAESPQTSEVDRARSGGGPYVILSAFAAIAFGVMFVLGGNEPEPADLPVAPVEVAADGSRSVESLISDAVPATTPPQRAPTARESAGPALPVWPGDVEERLPEPPGEGPLVVTVIDRGGRFVPGAQVRLATPISPAILPPRPGGVDEAAGTPTDADFLGVTDAYGRCRVRAVAGQTLLATDRQLHAAIAAVGDEAARSGRAELFLKPGTGLRATVIGLDGKGVAGAMVTAMAVDGGRSFTGAADACGTCLWRLDGECRYDVTARDGERLAETVRIPGRVGGVEEVRVRVLGVAAIDGRVLDPHGAPAAGASVKVTSDPRGGGRRGFEFSAASEEDGTFHLPLPGAGRYWVTAEHPDWARSPVGDFNVMVGNPTQASVRLAVRAEFQGVVRWKDGPPITGAAVSFETRAVFGAYGWVSEATETSSGEDGTYRLGNVSSEETYAATCVPDATRPFVRMARPGLRPSPQHFVFDFAATMGASIDVAINVDAGDAPREVVTRLRLHDGQRVWTPGVDEPLPVVAGRARLERLSPGATYTVDVRALGFGQVRSETFVAGQDPTATVRLSRAARLEVRVLDGREDVAVGAEVFLGDAFPQGLSLHARADARGRVAFTDLPPGSFRLHARRAERRPVEATVELVAGKLTRVELQLRR